MKATAGTPAVVTTETSQGGGIGDDDGEVINLDVILERAAQGDMKAYKEAKKKHGAEAVKKYIAQRTKVTAPVFDTK